ncbi:MAG: TonB family protein, partial [Bryobacteraceae bacterium]
MTPTADILDRRDPITKPFAASLFLHVAATSAVALGTWIEARGSPERWGEQNTVGGVVGVNPVANVPLPAREGALNPVANPTESQVPQPPAQPKPAEREAAPDPEAIAVQGKRDKKTQAEVASSNQRFRANPRETENQLFHSAGQALVTPIIAQPGAGGVGVGRGSPLGDRFGGYAAVVQRLIAEKWNTDDVDTRLRTAPPVKVMFTILRDGSIQDIKLSESSGNRVLDLSAQRAIHDVGRVPP